MPIYEFRCDECGRDFEELVRRAADPVECPGCASSRVSKKLSSFAFQGAREGGSSASAGAGSSSRGGGCGGCSAGSCAGCRH